MMKTKLTINLSALGLLVLTQAVLAADAYDCNQALKAGNQSQALNIAQDLLAKDKNNRAAWLCKAKAHGQLEQYDAALAAAEQTEKHSQTPEEHMLGLILLGDILKNKKELDQSLAKFNQSLALTQQYHNERFERIARNKIGDVLMLQNQAPAALEQFVLGSKLALNNNESADNFERIAASYNAQQRYDAAIEYWIKAAQMNEATGEVERLAHAYLELGRLYTLIQAYSLAENTLNKLMLLCQEYRNQYYEVKTDISLARTKQAAGDKAAALGFKQSAITLATQIGADDLLTEAQAL
jgi:tetratricopeptide (TPR) repeat protein